MKENTYLLAMDEHGNWKEPLFIIGGSVFDISDLWELGKALLDSKENNLKIPFETEIKWQHITEYLLFPNKKTEKNPLKTHNIAKENVDAYINSITYLIDKHLKTALFSIIELPEIELYSKWKNTAKSDKGNRKTLRAKLELFIREKASQNIIQRYSWWLGKDRLGLIAVDRFSNTKIKNNETVEESYQKSLRKIIYTGDKYNNPYTNIIPPFLAQSHLHAFIELNDFVIGAFSYLVKTLYSRKQLTTMEFVRRILEIIVQRIRKGPQGKLWGYGIFDIPHNKNTLKEKIKEKDIKKIGREIMSEDA